MVHGRVPGVRVGAQFPGLVEAILPFCASARTSPHNQVFLEGVKAALAADAAFAGGDYPAPPEAGLRAFGRVYAGWAYSQAFYRERLHRELGFETFEELLADWERDHLEWDANDLLAKLRTWQLGDISANYRYRGDFERALGAIRARAILVPCTTDLYFPPEDNAIEAEHMPNAELRPYASPWGHCVASPGRAGSDFPARPRRVCGGAARRRLNGPRPAPPVPSPGAVAHRANHGRSGEAVGMRPGGRRIARRAVRRSAAGGPATAMRTRPPRSGRRIWRCSHRTSRAG